MEAGGLRERKKRLMRQQLSDTATEMFMERGFGLWRIQFQALSRYLDGTRTPAQVHQAVTADVHRAARLIDTGLSSFAAFAGRSAGPDGDAAAFRCDSHHKRRKQSRS